MTYERLNVYGMITLFAYSYEQVILFLCIRRERTLAGALRPQGRNWNTLFFSAHLLFRKSFSKEFSLQ